MNPQVWFPLPALLHFVMLIVCGPFSVQCASKRLADHANGPRCLLQFLRHSLGWAAWFACFQSVSLLCARIFCGWFFQDGFESPTQPLSGPARSWSWDSNQDMSHSHWLSCSEMCSLCWRLWCIHQSVCSWWEISWPWRLCQLHTLNHGDRTLRVWSMYSSAPPCWVFCSWVHLLWMIQTRSLSWSYALCVVAWSFVHLSWERCTRYFSTLLPSFARSSPSFSLIIELLPLHMRGCWEWSCDNEAHSSRPSLTLTTWRISRGCFPMSVLIRRPLFSLERRQC